MTLLGIGDGGRLRGLAAPMAAKLMMLCRLSSSRVDALRAWFISCLLATGNSSDTWMDSTLPFFIIYVQDDGHFDPYQLRAPPVITNSREASRT
jgi:hypothetical protein